jgi:uncharacterized Ntn-hydrolase superfamily protein
MTFSIAGHCARTGMVGVAVTTSSICVASRCPWARAGVGAVSTQNITDPGLGIQALDLMAEGHAAAEALKRLLDGYPHAAYRQVTIVDAQGRTAHHSGAKTLGTNAVAEMPHCVAAGNLLSNADVPAAMTRNFAANPGLHLAERLLQALEVGVAAGGEKGPVKSAGLLVVDRQPWPLVDLRIDWHDLAPVGGLRALWDAYRPQMNDYLTRALDPAVAPAFGVPGDQ